ncbi:MAG: hypothetical protein H7061_13110 [Bdellovibrionaceae bacterium]|nr:hypothetical protein [Bdellovibrio sp.]
MTNQFQHAIKFIIVICLTIGAFLVVKTYVKKPSVHNAQSQSKSDILKSYLLKNKKPQRVEIFSYTKRFENEVQEIKKMKVPQDPKAKFYITIQFFTDESDPAAPLIAQVRFIDITSENQIKEESLNLE